MCYFWCEMVDICLLIEVGCDLVWMLLVEMMYLDGFVINIVVVGVSEGFDGLLWLGYFDGVVMVVLKLFN